MARVRLNRSDLFPVSTSVGIFDAAQPPNGGAPHGSAIASAAVDAAGLLTVDHASIPAGRTLLAYAAVNGEHRYARVRSTQDIFDTGGGTGTGDTASNATISNAGINTETLGAVTGTAATDLFARTAHGLQAGDAVRFTGLTGGTGITAGKTYYVIATGLTANAFAVSATLGGASIDFSADLTAGTVHRAAAFQAGQFITGAGIPSGTRILSVSGDTLTLSAAATATASGVALVAYGAQSWSARARRRRVAMGTS